MKRTIFALFLLVFLVAKPTLAQENQVSNEVLLHFEPNTSYAQKNEVLDQSEHILGYSVRQEAPREIAENLSRIGVVIIQVPPGRAKLFASILSKNKFVKFAEANALAMKMETANDPSIDQQWGLAKIHALSTSGESAWDITHGSTTIKVAVLDTGIDKNHSDLAGRVILEKDFSGSYNGPEDADGHGTHVAGSIAAITNNNIGVAGVSYTSSLINGKVLGNSGYGSYSNIAAGIVWATDNGAQVINMSLGGSRGSPTLQSAVEYAESKGVVVVAAAGNSGNQSPLYPAYFPGVVSVAATDQNDSKPSWSNYGNWVDVAAPGVSIYSTYKNGGYKTYSGTSMATSYVSGAAALVWSTGKCITDTCVVDLLESTADHITGTGSYWKYGRINLYEAVLSNSITPSTTSLPTNEPTATPVPSPTIVPSETPILTQTPIPSPTNVPQKSPTMTVSNIEMWSTKTYGLNDVLIRITVEDMDSHEPLSQASVSGRITSPWGNYYTGSGTTDGQGQVTFILRWQYPNGVYKGTINAVSRSGYEYDPTLTSQTLKVQ